MEQQLPAQIINQALTASQQMHCKVNIYQLPSGTFVIVPAGYQMPDIAKEVGYVNGNNITYTVEE